MSRLLKHSDVSRPQAAAALRLGRAPDAPAPTGPSAQELALQAAKEEARKAGHAEGLAAGKAEGLKQMEAELQRRMEALEIDFEEATELQLKQLLAQQERFASAVRARLSDCAMAVCARLLGEAWLTPQAAQAAVQHVLDQAGLADPFVVRCSRQHQALLAACFPSLKVEAADDIRGGGIKLEAKPMSLDASLATQLALIENALQATPLVLEPQQLSHDHE